MGNALDAHGGVGGGNAGVARGVVPDAVDLGDVVRVLLADTRTESSDAPVSYETSGTAGATYAAVEIEPCFASSAR